MQPVLGDLDRYLGQLADLVAGRLPRGLALGFGEGVPAAAVLRPVVDHHVDRLHRRQLATTTRMARLGSLPSSRGPGGLRSGAPGGSWLGGVEEFRELRFSRRSSSAIRSSCLATRSASRWICSSIRNSTATTTSRPWS